MNSYKKFGAKLIGIIAGSGALGGLLTRHVWGVLPGMALPPILYFGLDKLGRLERDRKLRHSEGAPVRTAPDGFQYRDLNKNGVLDVYEDPRESVERRVEDLLGRMTIEEKAGLLFSPQMDVVPGDKIALEGGANFGGDVVKQIWKFRINTFAAMGSLPPREFAKWNNALQKAAECTRLGIPVTVASDPRHVYVSKTNPLTTQRDDGLSSWPSSPGWGAIDDEALMEEYGKIAAKELTSIGIRFALNPVADTATEPRWPRIYETFGEDSEKNGKLAAAYIRGMQGPEIGKGSVACCVKHFPGGGPQRNGDDPHFYYGKEQVYPGGQFEYHVKPFKTAIDTGVSAVMPYYGVPIGLDGIEEVGFNFNKNITTDLLRKKLGFKGLVHTDYSIIEGIKIFGISCIPGRAWGIEKYSIGKRLVKAFEAGVDQIGGECCSRQLARQVRKGKISEDRLNESCRRVLELKFRLGLFDSPYVDEDKAAQECGKDEYVQAADDAMRRCLVLLKNAGAEEQKPVLPLPAHSKVYVEGFKDANLAPYAEQVDTLDAADYAIIWMDVPQRPDKRDPMSAMFESGDLDYTPDQIAHLTQIMEKCPTIVVLRMTRPAVIPEIKEKAAGIIAEFNVRTDIILEAVFGKFSPSGKLPFDLPASMDDVRTQKTDTPFDCKNTTYSYGFGLRYEADGAVSG